MRERAYHTGSREVKYMVTCDGRPLYRGLTEADAYRQADMLARGFDRHRASDKRRTGEFNVKVDRGYMTDEDRLYEAFKA